jgi:hypothetical protein
MPSEDFFYKFGHVFEMNDFNNIVKICECDTPGNRSSGRPIFSFVVVNRKRGQRPTRIDPKFLVFIGEWRHSSCFAWHGKKKSAVTVV